MRLNENVYNNNNVKANQSYSRMASGYKHTNKIGNNLNFR